MLPAKRSSLISGRGQLCCRASLGSTPLPGRLVPRRGSPAFRPSCRQVAAANGEPAPNCSQAGEWLNTSTSRPIRRPKNLESVRGTRAAEASSSLFGATIMRLGCPQLACIHAIWPQFSSSHLIKQLTRLIGIQSFRSGNKQVILEARRCQRDGASTFVVIDRFAYQVAARRLIGGH